MKETALQIVAALTAAICAAPAYSSKGEPTAAVAEMLKTADQEPKRLEDGAMVLTMAVFVDKRAEQLRAIGNKLNILLSINDGGFH